MSGFMLKMWLQEAIYSINLYTSFLFWKSFYFFSCIYHRNFFLLQKTERNQKLAGVREKFTIRPAKMCKRKIMLLNV